MTSGKRKVAADESLVANENAKVDPGSDQHNNQKRKQQECGNIHSIKTRRSSLDQRSKASPCKLSLSPIKRSSSNREDILKVLSGSFPGRKREIEDLLCLLGGPCDFLPPLLLHGGPGTGKTSIIREVFKHLGRPYAYASCRSCHTPRILFESLINSLTGHVRTSANNYSSARKCERASDFVDALPDACQQAVSQTKAQNGGSRDAATKAHNESSRELHATSPFGEADWFNGETEVIYLVIDNVDLVRSWASGLGLLQVLFKLPELARLPQLGMILISTPGPHAYMSGTGCREPVTLYFKDYRDEELFQILLSKQSAAVRDMYSSFLDAVLKPFSRATRRVTELSEVLEPLFDKYCEPVQHGKVQTDEKGKRKLFTLISPHVRSLTSNEPQRRASADPASDLHLPRCSKYLLLAAYIASTNPATLDASLFEMGGHETRKRRRKSSMSAMEKKDKEIHEKQLKGPGSFSLERLLAIFSCIAIEVDGKSTHYDTADVTGDVLMELSTLVSVNLVSQGLMDPLEGSPKYRCNADEDLVHRVAKGLNFPLNNYLVTGCFS